MLIWSSGGGSTLPTGEVDLRSKSVEGLRSIDLPRPLTRRYAPTSPRRGEVGPTI